MWVLVRFVRFGFGSIPISILYAVDSEIISRVDLIMNSVRVTCVIHVISGMFQQQNLGKCLKEKVGLEDSLEN